MPQARDVVFIEYELFVKEGTEWNLFETNIVETARREKAYDEERTYSPYAHVRGTTLFLPCISHTIERSEISGPESVLLEVERGPGEDPATCTGVWKTSELKHFSLGKVLDGLKLSRLEKKAVEAKIVDAGVKRGDKVQLSGRLGTVYSVSGGRVVVDFNFPLAGKEVKFRWRVLYAAEGIQGVVEGIAQRAYNYPKDFKAELLEDGTVRIVQPEVTKYDTHWPMCRPAFAKALHDLGYERVLLVEEWEAARRKPKTPPPEAEAEPQEPAPEVQRAKVS